MTDRDPDPLTKSEVEDLLQKGCLHPMDRAAVTLAVYTGLRPGELCALAHEDVDLVRGVIHVNRAITSSGTFKLPKTGKKRTVMLFPPALEACRELLTFKHNIEPQTITVQLTRHESIQETVTPLITPVVQARKKHVNVVHPFLMEFEVGEHPTPRTDPPPSPIPGPAHLRLLVPGSAW
ncbi:tyrosine-type recombinase/integrase [Stutzerimonas stutzeri]|uniref:tyrosine-type recombinase/integrase n=1 Tax=Stutzerimonas stutzeri TaxID=316 RepID=UPI000291ADC9|nr:tyrosine-type recombinase/integrase [Stutzerimonas stutzeri]